MPGGICSASGAEKKNELEILARPRIYFVSNNSDSFRKRNMMDLPVEDHLAAAGESSALKKIALVEDRRETRESLIQLLNTFNELKCVCVCASGEEALKQIPPTQPDVVLMDIFLPRMSGIECTARLKELLPHARILILTASNDGKMVFPALEAGADGYLLKQTEP